MSLSQKLRSLQEPESQQRLRRALARTSDVAFELCAANDVDPFVVAARAERQLFENRSIRPGLYADPDSQRAFSEAWCLLDQISRTARADVALRQRLDRYMGLLAALDGLRRPLGEDPRATLRRAEDQVRASEAQLPWSWLALGATLLPALFLLTPGLLLGGIGLPLLVGAIVLLVCSVPSSYRLAGALRQRQRRETQLTAMRKASRDVATFLADPERGGALRRLEREHPSLREVVMSKPPPASATPGSGFLRAA